MFKVKLLTVEGELKQKWETAFLKERNSFDAITKADC